MTNNDELLERYLSGKSDDEYLAYVIMNELDKVIKERRVEG